MASRQFEQDWKAYVRVELADEESEELPPIEDADLEALAAARVPHDAVPGVVAQVQRGFRGLADAISIA